MALPTFRAGDRDSRLAAVLADLDRCPHGRHQGDACAGWRGPGPYDGGCQGGRSLGNPYLIPGALIGYGIGGEEDPIVVPAEDTDRMDAAQWRPAHRQEGDS